MSDIRAEFVVAAGRNGVIGRDNGLPWRLPGDLKRFRALTLGKPVLMGRKTFQSIGKPLDGRANIVITRDPGFAADGVEVADSPDSALEMARVAARRMNADAVMVIGGAEIYKALREDADVIHLTRVDLTPDGDSYFDPPRWRKIHLDPDGDSYFDPAHWRKIHQEAVKAGPRDDADFTVETYVRIVQ